MNCLNCSIEFESKRTNTKYCSPRCKLQAFRKSSIETDNVTLSTPLETDNFEFCIISKANGMGRTENEKSKTRIAKYWYDVPLGAIPVMRKGWPDKPDYMNGRQYFLWWKNEFKTTNGAAVIHNPFPTRENVTYQQAGAESRRWGA